jgi:hypothetical protein
MALQTRFAELFLGGKKPPSSVAPEQATSIESVSALRASAPPKPSAQRSEPVPRISLTQLVGEYPTVSGSNDGATPGSVLGNGEIWEHATGADAVNWWLHEGSGNAGSRALDQVMTQLGEGLPVAERWERTGDVRSVIAEFAPMLAAMELPFVGAQLLTVGLTLPRLNEFRTLTLAFIQLEAPGAALDTDAVSIIEQGCALRSELVAACTWNLRGLRDVASLARITDSLHAVELALDLTELADLVSDNPAAFLADESFVASELTDHAVNLACKLRARHLHSSPCVSHEWGLRSQVFSLLMDRATEVQTAGAYALRHQPNWARAFGPVRNVSRRRSRLRDALGT